MSIQSRIIYINPYPVLIFYYIDHICLLWLMKPFIYFADKFLSSFFPTTLEIRHLYEWIVRRISTLILSAILVVVTFPLAVIGFMIWISIQWMKQPYRQSICIANMQKDHHSSKPSYNNAQCYSFATANICLLREFLCRFNNQTSPRSRAKKIGSRIRHSQMHNADLTGGESSNSETNACMVTDQSAPGTAYTERRRRSSLRHHCLTERKPPVINPETTTLNHDICTHFPDLDVLFIQEAFCNNYVEVLSRELHHCFPYIVYDAGVNSSSSNFFLLNSGLMIASKYPILNVNFDWFRSTIRQCRFASKGLLQVKILLGKRNGKNLVGYIYNTHLQSYQGNSPVQSNQLDNIEDWTKAFRKSTLKADDAVLFDVLAGDFNCDNLSPGDRDNWYHPLFKLYTDVCRERPGKDCYWTVGTEMRHRPLHDARIQTSEGLKQVLQDPRELQYYVLDANVDCANYDLAWLMPGQDKNGRQIWNPNGGRRRIDFVMYRKEDSHIKPVGMNAITQLAGLTDHIPFCLTIHCDEEKLHETLESQD